MHLVRKVLVLLLLPLFQATGLHAQDQTFTISDPPRILDSHTTNLVAEKATLTVEDAKTLIERTLGAGWVNNRNFYCMIHILKWKDDQTVAETQRWYTYHGGSWGQGQLEGARIFGSKTIGLIYVHLNARGLVDQGAVQRALSRLGPDALADILVRASGRQLSREEKDKEISNRKSGKTAVQLAAEISQTLPGILELPSSTVKIRAENGQVLVASKGGLVEKAYTPVAYKVAVTKKLPAPVQSLLAAVGFVLQSDADAFNLKTEKIAVWGGQVLRIDHVPSDITAHSLLGEDADQKEVSKQTYDNEGRYFWDVSIGLPVHKLKELEFNATDGTVRAKEIDKQRIFAMINIFPTPIDTKGTGIRAVPHLLVGVALTSKPLDRLFLGSGIGLNKVQIFAGAAWNKVEAPQTLAVGSAATPSQLSADSRSRYQAKFLVGLNLPLRQVLDALKEKK